MTTPVRITFTMRTPMVVPRVDKPLDALLSWAAVQQADFEGNEDPISMQHDIGLAKHTVGEQWCFMASNVTIDWYSPPSVVHYVKRQRLEDYVEAWDSGLLSKRPYFDGQRGSTKAGSYVLPTRWASTVSAFAVVEDMERLNALLPWVTHIGKLHHKDFGAVRSVEVVTDDTARTEWAWRNLPAGSDMARGHHASVGGLKSPYWRRDRHLEVLVSPR